MTQLFTYLLTHSVPCQLLHNDSAKCDILWSGDPGWGICVPTSNSDEIFVQCI